MDYISEYRSFKPVQALGIDRIHPEFETGLAVRKTWNMPNKAVQDLSLTVLGDLLKEGRDVLCYAARIYRDKPDDFKSKYASSRQAFLKDTILFRKVPEYSFPPFKKGDNPAFVRDGAIAETCAKLYQDSVADLNQPEEIPSNYSGWPSNYSGWLDTAVGERFSREMEWLRQVIKKQSQLADTHSRSLQQAKQKILGD